MGAARERAGRVWRCSPRRGRATQGEPAPTAAGCTSKNFTINPPPKKISTRLCLPEQARIIATALGWQFRVTRGTLPHEGMQFSIKKKYIYLFFEAPRALHCPPPKRPCPSCLPVLLQSFCCRIRPDDARSVGLTQTQGRACGRCRARARRCSDAPSIPLEAANSPKMSFSFAFGTSSLSCSSWWAQPRAAPAARGTWSCSWARCSLSLAPARTENISKQGRAPCPLS